MLSSRNRHRLFETGFRAIAATGAARWLRPLAQGRGIILTFHHVDPASPGDYSPNRLLTITPAFLDRVVTHLKASGFDIVGLDAVPDRLADEAAGTRPFAVLTFDDGYRDNVEHAVPVLRQHGVPWTLFVTSDFADGRGRLWWLELERAIAGLDRVRLPAGTGPALDLPATAVHEKSAAFEAVYRRLRAGSEAAMLSAISDLCEQAGIAPGREAARLCLTWPELRELAADPAVTIGAHTVTHPMLAKHGGDVALREIAESRDRITRELARPVHHLSYPVGDPTSAGAREFAMARDLGFTTAVTTRPGHLFAGHAGHRHALPRVSVNGCYQTDAALGALLSGVPFLVWNQGRRLDVA
ncbi:MAG TPA: polysaccharide deacetylase family protein [Methylobacterium sp.]|jgi:peptidoglycan/xylan/chitin deacetylase (PgdA/CDA1 family)